MTGLFERHWSRRDWQAVDHGFNAVQAEQRLTGWRRVVVLRRRIKDRLLAEVNAQGQQTLLFADTPEDVNPHICRHSTVAT